MPRSEAQKRAVKKYKEGKYKQLKVEIKIDEYNLIDEFSKEKGINKARFIVVACKEYIKKYGDTEGKESIPGRETTNTAGENSENLEEV